MTKETNPEWAKKIGQTMKERKINVGTRNAMKRPEVANRMSKTRREKVTNDQSYRQFHSQRMLEAWRTGKFDGVRVGCCKWFEHQRPNGERVKLQGTWELELAKWLDSKSIDYVAHPYRLSYVDVSGKRRSYFPDFYVPGWESYVDVKCDYTLALSGDKLKTVCEQNPGVTVKVMLRDDLRALGVDI
jgi:hypothetical protein